MKSTRYHLDVPDKKQLANGEIVSFSKRTTVTFPVELAELICCMNNVDPESEESHPTVRGWLQEQIDASNVSMAVRVSQWLRMRAVEAIAQPKLVERRRAFSMRPS